MADTFPRQYARTRRLTLGEPRNFTISPDGKRVVFLRSGAGDDPANGLWVYGVDKDEEVHVVDAADLLEQDEEALPPQERARRERVREQAGGIVAYATDAETTMAAFALAGRLFTVHLTTGGVHEVPTEGPVFDPRPDPTGRRVAYVSGRSLRIADLDGTTRIVEDDDPNVSWGSAEFIAAEEMDRHRGYWWAPDGERVAACRVDIGKVARWHLTDPAEPSTEPVELVYPAAGTANADVALAVIGLDGDTKYLGWDRETYPYLVTVTWKPDSPLTFLVQSRDQRMTQVLAADPATLATRVVSEDRDDAWVEIVPGAPDWLGERLVTAGDRDGARRLLIDDKPVTPVDLQLRSIVAVGDDDVVITANDLAEPTEQHVLRVHPGGGRRRSPPSPVCTRPSPRAAPWCFVAQRSRPVRPQRCKQPGGGRARSALVPKCPSSSPRAEIEAVGPAGCGPRCCFPGIASPTSATPCCSIPTGDLIIKQSCGRERVPVRPVAR